MPDFQQFAAGLFGAVLGWNLYFLNRYRTGIGLGDLATILGVIGGAAVLALFPAGSERFSAYAVGLAIGFFGYFVVLLILVGRSQSFSGDWFIDGRYTDAAGNIVVPDPAKRGQQPMQIRVEEQPRGNQAPGVRQ